MPNPVINLTTSVLGYPQWKSWTYQPWASGLTGSADTWTSSALPPGMTLNATTGALSGAVTQAGVYNVGIQVTNANGVSAPVMLTIGIEARAFAARSGVDLFVNVATGAVSLTLDGSSLSDTEVQTLFTLKEEDDLLLYIHFFRDGTIMDLGSLQDLKFGFKENDGDGLLVISAEFAKSGTGQETVYIAYIHLKSGDFEAALSNHETDTGTSFAAHSEILWNEPNTTLPKVGPDFLQRRSQTFDVLAVKNLIPDLEA